MEQPLPFFAPDPRQLPATGGEAFRRHCRAQVLMEASEYVDSERRSEIGREILVLGADALPVLSRAANSRQENAAALARSLIRLLVPDEIGRQIYGGLLREKKFYAVEQGAVQLARLAYPNLPVQRVIRDIDELARKARSFIYGQMGVEKAETKAAASQRPLDVIRLLGEFWREEGFHGNVEDYYSEKNSYLPDVLERRTGLPISLSVLYLAVSRRVHLTTEGVGMPGHFIVRVKVTTKDGEQFVLIDPFRGARALNVEDCKQQVESTGQPFVPDEHLKATTAIEILGRMCHNLLALFDHQKKTLEAERVATVLVHLQPRDPVPLLIRAERRLRRNERPGARADFEKARTLDPSGPIGRTAEELLRRMDFENPFK
jgi:regulator of sirC expression with transglutaminase-like and TPR domain